MQNFIKIHLEVLMNYKVIEIKDIQKINQYQWFRQFSNPCYGFNVKMDITRLVHYTKEHHQNFFINTLYLITTALNQIEEMRIREVNGEIRLYDKINPTFTVMTSVGIYENTGFEMVDDYREFYKRAHSIIEKVKKQTKVKETYNDSTLYNDFYMTCIPWLSIESMTHPLIDNDYASLSCPRVCWDKYREENGKIIMTLNITVSHCFVDGYPLSQAFLLIQEYFNNLTGIIE